MTHIGRPSARLGHSLTLALSVLVLLALASSIVVLALASAIVLGAEPSPSPVLEVSASGGELLEGGDPRSEGEGPGLVGSPLVILAAVVGLGLATAAVTLVLARIAQRR